MVAKCISKEQNSLIQAARKLKLNIIHCSFNLTACNLLLETLYFKSGLASVFFNFDSRECPVIVMGNSLHHVHFGPWHTADRTVPAVPNAHVEVSVVEIFKVLVQWDKVLKHIKSTQSKRKIHTTAKLE